MNPRTTAFLAVAAALFAAFLWFYEVEGEAGRAKDAAESLRVFNEIPDDGSSIAWIEFVSSDGVKVRAERHEERWELVLPVVFPADAVALDAMSSALAQLAGGGAIESPQSAEVYGLDAAARRIDFGDSASSSLTLLTGRATPIGSSTYVAAGGSEDVHAVPSWRINAFDKAFKALRDARVHPFDREAVREIAVRWPEGAARLVLEEDATGTGSWRMVEPLETVPDAGRIDSLLTDLMHLRADGFVDSEMSDANAGLDPPDFAVELGLGDAGGAPVHVAIGQDRDGLRTVRGRDGALYELSSARLDDFPRSVLELRDRTLSRFIGGDVRRFELRFGGDDASGAPVVVTREDLDWLSDPPLRDGVGADIVANLSNLVARDIQAEWLGEAERAALGLVPPRVSVRVFGDGEPAEQLAEVWLGNLDGGRGIAAMVPGRDEVFLLDSRIAENLPTSRAAFEEAFVALSEAAEAGPDEELRQEGVEPE